MSLLLLVPIMVATNVLIPRATEGSDITVTCEATGIGYLTPTIMWSKTDGPMLSGRVSVSDTVNLTTGNENVTRVSVNLTITNAYRDDTGVYRCFANNNMGNDSTDIKIIIQC